MYVIKPREDQSVSMKVFINTQMICTEMRVVAIGELTMIEDLLVMKWAEDFSLDLEGLVFDLHSNF